jgi:predicted house-cleaning noncanonical NTP pyrophosphatase (MazG superfamily)
MPTYILNKLVRDKIPADQERTLQRPVYHKLDRASHAKALVDKLTEEAGEIPVEDKAEAIKEIADVQQVLDDLAITLGINKTEIAEAQAQKAARNGAFQEGYFVESVSPDAGSDWDAYYGSEPDRFKKVS